jgi:hypothetical protein
MRTTRNMIFPRFLEHLCHRPKHSLVWLLNENICQSSGTATLLSILQQTQPINQTIRLCVAETNQPPSNFRFRCSNLNSVQHESYKNVRAIKKGLLKWDLRRSKSLSLNFSNIRSPLALKPGRPDDTKPLSSQISTPDTFRINKVQTRILLKYDM